jgi:2-methylisocitrate lyase-like PEP mutase family enzyme
MVHVYPNNVEETRRAPKEIAGPVNCGVSDGNRKGRPILSVQELSDMGYKMISFPNPAIMAVAMAVKETLETLKATGRTGLNQAEFLGVRKYVEETIGLEEMYKIEAATVERQA